MSQRIVLVQPRIVIGGSLSIEKAPGSIQALAGQLEKEGYDVQMYHEKAGDELYRKLAEFNPGYVGISAMTPVFLEGKKIARVVKEINPNILVILGGCHASGCTSSYLQGQESETIEEILNPKSPFDFIVAGEGDLVLPELISRLEKGVKVHDLRGIGFLNDNKVKISFVDRIKSLDDLADPSWKGLPVDSYRDKKSGARDLIVHFNRGCRFNCSFCSTRTIYGRGVRIFNAERAVKYIGYLLEEFKPQGITFFDEDFFANPRWVAEVVELITQRDFHGRYGTRFNTFANINDLLYLEKRGGGAFLDKMKQAGFRSFELGIESFNPDVLRKYNREPKILLTMAREQRERYKQDSRQQQNKMLVAYYLNCAQRAINFANEHAIQVVGDYMIGNLGETEERIREGFKKFSNLRNLHIAYLPVFTPFPGTGLWKEIYDSGRIVRDSAGNIDWSRFDTSGGALNLDYNIEGLRNELELQFYTSERYRRDMLKEIRRNPARIGMFKRRFNYMKNHLSPGNELVEKRLQELG